ncbi:hypothetical protein RGAI101_3336 [Roseobacter sp. GAI101]|nr:hypothetical protein RGAI101_3336 [Roseobacter sp. GAI101]
MVILVSTTSSAWRYRFKRRALKLPSEKYEKSLSGLFCDIPPQRDTGPFHLMWFARM